MATPVSELSINQAYSEAKEQLKRNPERRLGAVKPAFAQKLQWHVWSDGTNCRSMIREVTKTGVVYSPGPDLTVAGINNGESLTAATESILADNKIRLDQLGIIYHYAISADSQSVRKPEEMNGADAEGMIQIEPSAVVKENIQQHLANSQWVYVPGKNPISLRFQNKIVETWTNAIEGLGLLSLAVVSSPLELVALLEAFEPGKNAHKVHTGHVMVIRYSKFTLFAVTDKDGGLLTIRPVANGPRGLPNGFAATLNDVCAGQLGDKPALTLLSMVPDKSTEDMASEIQKHLEHAEPEFNGDNVTDLEEGNLLSLSTSLGVTIEEVSGSKYVIIEALNCEDLLYKEGEFENESSIELRRVSRANIYRRSPADQDAELGPGPASLLYYSRWLKRIGFLGILLLGGWFGWNIYQEVSTESYTADPATLAASTAKLQADNTMLAKMKDRRNLLTTRSTYWIATEPISRLFLTNSQNNQEGGPILKMTKVTYTLQVNWQASVPNHVAPAPATAPADATATGGQPTAPAPAPKEKKGVEMVRTWHVEGNADEKGRQEFETIGATDTIKNILDQLADDMNTPSLKSSTTTVVRNVRPAITRSLATSDSDNTAPYHFTLDFEQVIRPNDPNALTP